MERSSSEIYLQQELAELQVAAVSLAQNVIPDAKVRLEYIAETAKYAKELQEEVTLNRLSPQQAANQARAMRNTIMEAKRLKTSPLGLALAQRIKKEGKTLAELEVKYARELFGRDFESLSPNDRNDVWRKIVQKSGEPQLKASTGARWSGRAGRGLFVLTIIISVRNIAVAEDKVRATANEGSAIVGGLAGAAWLGPKGMACGPAAIACVPLAIFIGGVVGAGGADFIFDQIWRVE